ncbi:hypothetical protein D6C84_10482 [Aureobasidium pullulans]|uniref:Uncharacterized protein n=1 Tax=Aureobasidium pullulans TaxID=5580 RepID=A0A4V4KXJ9_AURPU|nr:hypothetical protein D6C84_10482 [Aureobasidium pullulans]
MYDLTEDMFDNKSVAASSTGMMTPTSTVTGDSTNVEKQEPTIAIRLTIKSSRGSKNIEIKLRRIMFFGDLVQILKTKFDIFEGSVLQMDVSPSGPSEWWIVFDSDTPASLGLKDRASFCFNYASAQALDVSKML